MMRSITKLARWLVPLGIAELVRTRRARPRKLWQGSYESFSAVPVAGSGHESAEWIAPQVEATRRFRRQMSDTSVLRPDVPARYLVLPACAAALVQRQRTLRVLDFGGGVGIAYVYFAATMPPGTPYEYFVVDNAPSCVAGRAIYHDDSRIRFFENLNDVPPVDIVFMSGVLQYVSDYGGVVRRLSELQPTLIVITLIPVGDFETFASAQVNVPDTTFAHWFFSRKELVEEVFGACGYYPTLTSSLEQPFDVSNYPAPQRLLQMSNWVFKRASAPAVTRADT